MAGLCTNPGEDRDAASPQTTYIEQAMALPPQPVSERDHRRLVVLLHAFRHTPIVSGT
jgi:hypothetical protein